MASTELSFNKKVAIVKLILSSLYARKQKFMGIDAKQKGLFFLSNIPLDRTTIYRPDIDDTIAKVQLGGLPLDLLYEAFPQFEEFTGVLNLQPFTSVMNKRLSTDKAWPKLDIDTETDIISMKLPSNTTALVEVSPEIQEGGSVKVGRLAPPNLFELYERIFRHFNSFVEQPLERDVQIPTAYANDKIIMSDVDLKNDEKGTVETFRVPLQDGTNIPSFKEYLSKRKIPWTYRLLVQYNQHQNAAKVSVSYRDDWVTTQTIMPGTIWFPFATNLH